MLSLLEELQPKFKKKFMDNVDWKEVTVLSLHLSSRTAIIVTNLYLYILRKKMFVINCKKIALHKIQDISFSGYLFIKTKADDEIKIEVEDKKVLLVKKAIKIIKKKIP